MSKRELKERRNYLETDLPKGFIRGFSFALVSLMLFLPKRAGVYVHVSNIAK